MSNDKKDPTKTNRKHKNLENHFKSLVKSIKEYFPRIDEILILDILRLEYFKPDWQGTTTIEIQYSRKNAVKLDEKRTNCMINSACFLWKRMKTLYVLRQKECIRKKSRSYLIIIWT